MGVKRNITPVTAFWKAAAATTYKNPFEFKISAAFGGKALDPVKESTFKVQMVADPCEPPSIDAANKDKKVTFDYELRGWDTKVYTWTPLVFKPSHCQPLKYDYTLNTAASKIADWSKDQSADVAWKKIFVWTYGKMTIDPRVSGKGYPMTKTGSWVFDLTARTTVGDKAITVTGAKITVTINVSDPCVAGAVDPKLVDQSAMYVIGQKDPLRIKWAGFTFSNAKCNDGSIPFPTCYSGVVDTKLPVAAWKQDMYANEWQAPEWVIATSDVKLLLKTFTLTYSSVYLTKKTENQVVKLTINDKCEAIDKVNAPVIKVTTPTFSEPIEYHLSDPEMAVTIPKFTIVPSDCVMTLKVTIPAALEGLVKLNTAGTVLHFDGKKTEIGDYTITAQAKTPVGTLIPGAIVKMPVIVKAAKVAGTAVRQITTIALSTAAAFSGALVGTAGKVGSIPKTGGATATKASVAESGSISPDGGSNGVVSENSGAEIDVDSAKSADTDVESADGANDFDAI